ncbi:hypothetical protein TcCL_ESM10051 [Trypanosoma cruzi]|nr:hypothetical protein TcCL_ESM10051 [Trypanosoma cruzi]
MNSGRNTSARAAAGQESIRTRHRHPKCQTTHRPHAANITPTTHRKDPNHALPSSLLARCRTMAARQRGYPRQKLPLATASNVPCGPHTTLRIVRGRPPLTHIIANASHSATTNTAKRVPTPPTAGTSVPHTQRQKKKIAQKRADTHTSTRTAQSLSHHMRGPAGTATKDTRAHATLAIPAPRNTKRGIHRSSDTAQASNAGGGDEVGTHSLPCFVWANGSAHERLQMCAYSKTDHDKRSLFIHSWVAACWSTVRHIHHNNTPRTAGL